MLIAGRWSPGYARDGDSLLFNGIRKEISPNIDNGHMKELCARVCNILHKITSIQRRAASALLVNTSAPASRHCAACTESRWGSPSVPQSEMMQVSDLPSCFACFRAARITGAYTDAGSGCEQ